MAPPKGPAGKVKANSSPTRAKVGLSSSQEGKKMMGLSSFQATLNFTALPASGPSSAPSRLGSTSVAKGKSKAAASSLVNGKLPSGSQEDKKLMPPPPAGLQTKSRISAASSGKVPAGKGKAASGKGKGKATVIEVLDSDSEDEDSGRSKASSSRHAGMWADVYPPATEADLAPGKARISKVKSWLHEALYGCPPDAPSHLKNNRAATDKIRKYRRILLLTGPAGAGKTTTIRVLAKDMGVDLMEWGEGVEEWSMGGSGIDRESSISKFSSFLSRNTYAPLPSSSSSSSQPSTPRSRLLFLTSLPNISHSTTKETFHASLRQFCSTYTSSSCPMVIIHSEAGTNGSAEESWRERDRGGKEGILQILGKEVKESPWCLEIEFLPVAPTFQIKALKKVLEVASAASPFPLPAVAAVQLLALNSNGDLRSAVNSLQMLCMRIRAESKKRANEADDGGGGKRRRVGSTGAVGRGSRGGKGSKLDVPKDLRAVLDALTRKEQSLHLFHALGKVLYNKRLDDPPTDKDDEAMIDQIRQIPPDDPLPPHLKEYERRKPLVQMENFVGSVPLDSSSFTLWIHQSVPTFCTEIEEASAAIDEMCSADIMRTDDDIDQELTKQWQSSQQAISYALQLSIRGAQLSLPTPMPRNHQKILKPQWFGAYKDEKKNLELLDVAAGYLAKRAVGASAPLAEVDLGETGPEGAAPWGGVVGRGVLAGELVPMLVKMQGLTSRSLLPASVAPLRMPAFGKISSGRIGEELTASQTDVEERGTEEGEEEDAGVLSVGWDREEELVVEEKGWLEEDDIQDWD